MRVHVLYTDSSGTYRVRADIRENNRTVHIIDLVDNDYGSEAEWDDFTDEEQANIHALLLEEYDAITREPSDSTGDYADGEDEEDGNDPPSDY